MSDIRNNDSGAIERLFSGMTGPEDYEAIRSTENQEVLADITEVEDWLRQNTVKDVYDRILQMEDLYDRLVDIRKESYLRYAFSLGLTIISEAREERALFSSPADSGKRDQAVRDIMGIYFDSIYSEGSLIPADRHDGQLLKEIYLLGAIDRDKMLR